MKLSMWIFADWLKEYNPILQIQSGLPEISSARLFPSTDLQMQNTMYIGRLRDFFHTQDQSVICAHNNDLIILRTSNLEDVLNSILQAFDFYSEWNSDMLKEISSGCMVSSLLKRSETIINEPIFLLDSAQRMLTMSAQFSSEFIDPLWSQMENRGSADVSWVIQFNQKHSLLHKQKDLYLFDDFELSPNRVYCFNFFLQDNWIGVCNIIDIHRNLSRGVLELFKLLCNYFKLWFEAHAQQQSLMLLDELLYLSISGQAYDQISFSRQLEQIGWKPQCQKKLLILNHTSKQFNISAHVCKVVNLMSNSCYAIVHNSSICILCNTSRKSFSDLLRELNVLLNGSGYYGSYSDTFYVLDEIQDYFLQASVTAEYCPKESGKFYSYQTYTLPYSFSIIHQYMNTRFIHPDILTLIEYDKTHHTELNQTLNRYLTCERNCTKTAQLLNIHRHTLTYRLKKIAELINDDLENADTRLHLLCSYTYLHMYP